MEGHTLDEAHAVPTRSRPTQPEEVAVRQRREGHRGDEHAAHGVHLLLPDVPVSPSSWNFDVVFPFLSDDFFCIYALVLTCRSFALLCKVGKPALSRDGRTLDFQDAPLLEAATIRMSKFLLTFFVNHDDGNKVVRPYTNSNFILDFYRFRSSPYWARFVKYLRYQGVPTPVYEKQYETIMSFYCYVKELHGYDRFVLEGATSSTPNSKSLQLISSADGGQEKLGRGDYYKYRACNLMFGCNANIMMEFWCFSEFNAWRKNQLLAFYDGIRNRIADLPSALARNKVTKYRDYYFMPQFEIGQRELIDLHHYTYVMDMISMGVNKKELATMVADVNKHLVYHIYFSQNNRNNYHKMMKTDQFVNARKYMNVFLETFLTVSWFTEFVALGFADMNPREKEINSMTQTVFYSIDLMRGFGYRQEYEFEKEAINQMARTTIRRYDCTFAQQVSPLERADGVLICADPISPSRDYNRNRASTSPTASSFRSAWVTRIPSTTP